MEVSGYKAYSIYLSVKHSHFKNNNYNVMSGKYSKKFLNKWNTNRAKSDGYIFQEIQKKYRNIKVLKLLFSTYYVNNSNFFIRDIITDDFKIFKKNLEYLKEIEKNFTIDFENVILNYKLTDILISENSIPEIFKLGYSWNFLVIMNNSFNIVGKNKDIKINSLEEAKWNEIKVNLEKYNMVISEFIEYDWKQIIKSLIKN